MRTRKTPTTIAIATLALGATACGSAADDEATTGAGHGSTATTTKAHHSSSSGVAQAVRALRTAKKHVSHGRPYDLETTRVRGRSVWEIKVAAGRQRPHEVHVSGNGREVVRRSRHKRDDDVAKAGRATVSLARALRTADRHADGRLSEAEIDWTHAGTVVWTATFEKGTTETEVAVDARTGKVTGTTKGDD